VRASGSNRPQEIEQEGRMRKRQFFALLVCNLVPWTIGTGMTPLLPSYLGRLGLSPAVAGYYMALSYIVLATGTVTGGWLSGKVQRKKGWIVTCGVASIPAVCLMGQATNVWCLAALSAIFYFCGGVTVALLNILCGLLAGEAERGKIFGFLGSSVALGSLISGATVGLIADQWGYAAMYAALALFGLLWPLAGLFLADRAVTPVGDRGAATGGQRPGLGRNYRLLFVASLTAAVAGLVFFVARSLTMHDLGFAATAISSTGAIGGLVGLPMPLVVGWLSDRIGRKRFLAISYCGCTLSLLALAGSASLWHFWVASFLYALSTTNGTVGSAFVADLLPERSLGKGLSLFNATSSIAGVIGAAGTGWAVQNFGCAVVLLGGAVLPLAAIGLLAPIRPSAQEETGSGSQPAGVSVAQPLGACCA
jgi:MFS family permease